MRVMLDTDCASYAAKQRSPALARRLAAPGLDVVVSAMTEAEMRYGLLRLAPEHPIQERVRAFLDAVRIEPWSAAREHARLRWTLPRGAGTIGPFDEMIAAHAIATGRGLVTRNVRHFSRVPGLAIEDWTAP